jgi:peroxiredoxin family protein
MTDDAQPRKLAIINSKGSLDMAYPGLILGNAGRMLGIEVAMFYTFWGMDIITKSKRQGLAVTPVGNPAMHMPQIVSVIPGISAMATTMMKKEMNRLDAPPVGEFMEMVHDAGAKFFACKMSYDMMKLKPEDLVPEVDEVVTAMDFLEWAEGAQIIFI